MPRNVLLTNLLLYNTPLAAANNPFAARNDSFGCLVRLQHSLYLNLSGGWLNRSQPYEHLKEGGKFCEVSV